MLENQETCILSKELTLDGSLVLPMIPYQLVLNIIFIHCLYNMKTEVLRKKIHLE